MLLALWEGWDVDSWNAPTAFSLGGFTQSCRKTWGQAYDVAIEDRPSTLTVFENTWEITVEDEHSQLKKSLRGLLPALAGMLIGQGIYNWHRFGYLGFKAFRWDTFFVQAFGAISITICFGLLGERKEITTSGIGETKAK